MSKEELEDVLMDMMKDRVDAEKQRAEQQARASDIKGIMAKLKYTAEQAMDLLSIPESQRETYAALIERSTR